MAIFTKRGFFDANKIHHINITQIQPSPNQPRRVFEESALQSLADSIGTLGILQPLTVRRVEEGWQLVAGERRLRAAQLAGLHQVPCLVISTDSQTASLLTMVENIQRQDLNFLEESRGLQDILQRYHLSQEQLAQRLGRSQSAIANKLRLLKLPEDVLTALCQNGYTERHARALLRLTDPQQLQTATDTIIKERLTVAQTEALVDNLLSPPPKKPNPRIRFVPKDIRIFLNTVHRSLRLMQSAGLDARCVQEEGDGEYVVTIRIAKTVD